MENAKVLVNQVNERFEIFLSESYEFDFDSVFKFYTWNKYRSISKQEYYSAKEWYDSIMGEGTFEKQKEISLANDRSSVGFSFDLASNLDKIGIFAVPIFTHEHSEIIYYIGDSIDRWEGSIVGFAWAHKSDLYKEFACSRLTKQIKEKAKEQISNFLSLYTDWANGYVYGFRIIDKNEYIVDSLGGFFQTGSFEDMLKEMFDHTDCNMSDFVEID